MTSMLKKAMIYLGLGPDEAYEQDPHLRQMEAEADGVGDVTTPPPRPVARPTVRPAPVGTSAPRPVTPSPATVASTGTVRPMPRPVQTAGPPPEAAGRPAPAAPSGAGVGAGPVSRPGSAVRTIGPVSATPHTVSPRSFNDAPEIGDTFKSGRPVIVNLQDVERDLRRRLIDFSSGLCYALGGKMSRVADHVFLLTPAGVDPERPDRDQPVS